MLRKAILLVEALRVDKRSHREVKPKRRPQRQVRRYGQAGKTEGRSGVLQAERGKHPKGMSQVKYCSKLKLDKHREGQAGLGQHHSRKAAESSPEGGVWGGHAMVA